MQSPEDIAKKIKSYSHGEFNKGKCIINEINQKIKMYRYLIEDTGLKKLILTVLFQIIFIKTNKL